MIIYKLFMKFWILDCTLIRHFLWWSVMILIMIACFCCEFGGKWLVGTQLPVNKFYVHDGEWYICWCTLTMIVLTMIVSSMWVTLVSVVWLIDSVSSVCDRVRLMNLWMNYYHCRHLRMSICYSETVSCIFCNKYTPFLLIFSFNYWNTINCNFGIIIAPYPQINCIKI